MWFSSTAANFYATLAADILEDDTDLEDVKEEIKPLKQEIVKNEPEQQPSKFEIYVKNSTL